MAKWPRNSIAVMARAAGWGARAEDVSWVAMSESGGDDSVVNSIGCVGLLQINQPVHVGAHPTWTRKWLQNPINNLKAGLVLYKGAGSSFDAPWADSKTKGGIPGGWGPKVTGGSTGATQAADDPCDALKGTPGYEFCTRGNGDTGTPADDLQEAAAQIGRIAQAVAKAGNWLADPGNWVRITYVAGGGLLALTAVAVIIRPYSAAAYRDVRRVLPVQSARAAGRKLRPSTTTSTEE